MSWRDLDGELADMFDSYTHTTTPGGWSPELAPRRVELLAPKPGRRCRSCASPLGVQSAAFPFCDAPCAHAYAGAMPKTCGGVRDNGCKQCGKPLGRPRGRFAFCDATCAHAHGGIKQCA